MMSPPEPERLSRVVSGGQTGVDRAALDAARESSIPHGGWCPRGRLAEDGPIPDQYALRETSSSDYAERTERNVVDSDATLILTRGKPTGGTAYTIDMAKKHKKPYWVAQVDDPAVEEGICRWLRTHSIETLNVAGPRESTCEGIYEAARGVLFSVMEDLS